MNKNKKGELKNNKLVLLTYYLKLFFILNHNIKLFYQTYLIYLSTWIKLLRLYLFIHFIEKPKIFSFFFIKLKIIYWY